MKNYYLFFDLSIPRFKHCIFSIFSFSIFLYPDKYIFAFLHFLMFAFLHIFSVENLLIIPKKISIKNQILKYRVFHYYLTNEHVHIILGRNYETNCIRNKVTTVLGNSMEITKIIGSKFKTL